MTTRILPWLRRNARWSRTAGPVPRPILFMLGICCFLASRPAAPATTEAIDEAPGFPCGDLAGDGNCVFEHCGCNEWAPGGACFNGGCDPGTGGGGGQGGGGGAGTGGTGTGGAGGGQQAKENCDTPDDDDGDGAINCEDSDCLTFTVEVQIDDGETTKAKHVGVPTRFTAKVVSRCPLDLIYFWSFGDGAESEAVRPTHVYDTPGEYAVHLDVLCADCASSSSAQSSTAHVTAFDVHLATSPGSDFVLKGAQGKASFNVPLKVNPSSVASTLMPLVRLGLEETPAGTTATFTPAAGGDAGGKPTIAAKLTGYPVSNDGFGENAVVLEVLDGTRVVARAREDIRLFFARDDEATGADVPNWARYWPDAIMQAAHHGDIGVMLLTGQPSDWRPGDDPIWGETAAMVYWDYGFVPAKDIVTLYYEPFIHVSRDKVNAWGNMVTGIDSVANTLLHEAAHVRQIEDADSLVDTSKASWTFGWSFNKIVHNHWSVGGDGKPGCPGINDDGVGGADNFLAAPVPGAATLGELGMGGCDVLLEEPGKGGWPKAFGDPKRGTAMTSTRCGSKSYFEIHACTFEPEQDHQFAYLDWACPGKQHGGTTCN
jgi:hypothetical protein